MKHGIITKYIIDFLNRGIQDRHREYTCDFCRNTHFRDQLNIFPCCLTWYDDYTIIIIINHHQNVFFMHNHNGQVQDPLNIIIYTMIEMWIFVD